MVRTEPLMLVAGKLEKLAAAGGAINILVDWVGSIDAPDQIVAEIKDFSMLDEQVRRGLAEQKAAAGQWRTVRAAAGAGGGGTGEAEDFRAVAPPIMSFASGRQAMSRATAHPGGPRDKVRACLRSPHSSRSGSSWRLACSSWPRAARARHRPRGVTAAGAAAP